MKTTFRAREPYASIFLGCADRFVCNSPVKPVHFMEVMRKNRGTVGMIPGQDNKDENGLELRNPIIVALGDSVTAGHFESLIPNDIDELKKFGEKVIEDAKNGENYPAMEITDARESYLEKFRFLLIDKYENTSVSVINAGIAADYLPSMCARMQRDVISHNPDLVLINGALNWEESMGNAAEYKELLRSMVRKIKADTKADIILLTPNGDLPFDTLWARQYGMSKDHTTTHERVAAIRELASEESVCLADVYAVWEMAGKAGCPWKELLANGYNHPGVEGHEVYAKVLMKLFE